jgi:hypothetical protein
MAATAQTAIAVIGIDVGKTNPIAVKRRAIRLA